MEQETEPHKQDELRGDLSEFGIKLLRDFAAHNKWSRSQLGTMLQEEASRARGLPPTLDGLTQFWKLKRAGSKFRLTRAARTAVFAQLVGKRVLK